VLEERVLPVDRGRRDGARLRVVGVATKAASQALDADLLEIGRRDLLEGAPAQALASGLPVGLVIPE